MTPIEIKALRHQHELSREELGKLVYQTARAVYAWELGERQIPRALWELLQLKLKHPQLELEFN